MIFQMIALYPPAAIGQGTKSSRHDAAVMEQEYRHALKLYKQGKPEAALIILDRLHHAHPEDGRFLYDYVAIASASGKHDLAIAAQELNLNIAPAYVLEALASSQRQVKNYEASLAIYDLAVKRFPERVDTQIARVNTLIDAQRFQQAESGVSALQKKYPGRIDVMECALRLSDHIKQPIDTLRVAEKILKADPGNRFALRIRFYALRKLGAAHLAVQLTPVSILSESEQAEAERDRLAFELRWARISADRNVPASRWKEMDATIAKLEEMCKLADGEGSVAKVARGECGDLVEALTNRQRMKEAIALYEHMADKQWAIQPYVQFAAATAYLDERQPEKASALFASALQKEPGNFGGRSGYIYALLESEQYQEADRQVDQLVADTGEWRNAKFPAIREPNPAYPQAQLTGALIRSYTNRLSEAENRLHSLAARAPNNTEIRQALAATYNSRGWPRRAENDLEWLDAAHPANVWTRLGLYDNSMAIGDFRKAELQLNGAARLAPDEKPVQKAQRAWETHNLRELLVESTIGKSADDNVTLNGSHETVIDAQVYSRPAHHDWRAFLHTQYASSTFPALAVSRTTEGAGVEYQIRDLVASGEIRNTGNSGVGFALNWDYHIGDHWSVGGTAENKSLSTPLRAYSDGVSANLYQLGGAYRWHESRTAALNISRMNFSDGNQRNFADAYWTERLWSGTRYKLDSTVEYYVSRNSSPDTSINYFNPVSDRQIGITLRNEWLQFQHYEKSLKHVLTIGAGNYAQQNFASGSTMRIAYEQYYSLSDRLDLHYGIGRTVHPYDGVRNSEDAITFAADWRF